MDKNDEWKFIYWDEPIDDKKETDETDSKSKPKTIKDNEK
jgi:hypothetical protein